jgi:outer membrane protein OmpA-like peptidoglycan-associated protein/uncharacterized protein YidB (DUF937 family)
VAVFERLMRSTNLRHKGHIHSSYSLRELDNRLELIRKTRARGAGSDFALSHSTRDREPRSGRRMFMSVLDSVVHDVGGQLGISSSSVSSVLSELLAFINREDGGVGAFLERFRRAGVGGLVNSWLGGETKAVAVETVESALGRDTISNIANRAGISFSTAASAIAMLLPKLIQRLAPGGAIPSRLAPEIASYISGPTAAMATGARHAAAYSGTVARSPGIGRYLWPLFALAILGGLLLWLANRGTPTVNRAVFNIEEQARLASQRAVNALTALRPGYTVQEFLQAVNLNVINFATGSASVPAESYDVLNRAATALKSAPAGTPIEIGGHTDNTGNAAANLQLSQQRAEAVRAYLIQQGVDGSTLTARGYGDTRPVASNDTDEGRFRNRRIEFAAR